MSIEAMKLVIGAFDSLSPDHPASHTVLHINALRAALSQQPATGEPVYQICKKDSQCISSAWIDVEKQAYEDAGMYPEYGRRTLYTRPVPSVPMTPASRSVIISTRTANANADADEWPVVRAYQRGWNNAEAHHGITAQEGTNGEIN